MDVLVFGAGSLGSLVGGLLARAHTVTLVGRDPHVSVVRESGLRVSGAVETTASLDAVTDATGLAADLAVVTVKAFDTDAAAEALATGRYDAVLSLQNGLTEERLAAALSVPVLAGTATYGARLVDPGHVVCTGVGEVVVGTLDDRHGSLADTFASEFEASGIETTVADDMPRRRWEKLAVNAAINPTTALARVENGVLADGPANEVARRAAVETARVARAEGVDLRDARVRDALDSVIEATETNRSSMLQDVDSGQRTEVDAILGEVVDRGARHGVAVPTVRTLRSLLQTWEASRGLR